MDELHKEKELENMEAAEGEFFVKEAQRAEWLRKNMSTEEDVKEDEQGEYVWHTEHDGEQGAKEKIYFITE